MQHRTMRKARDIRDQLEGLLERVEIEQVIIMLQYFSCLLCLCTKKIHFQHSGLFLNILRNRVMIQLQ